MQRWINEGGALRRGDLGPFLYALQKWQDSHPDYRTRHMTEEDWEEIGRYRREFDAALDSVEPAAGGGGVEQS